MGVLHQALQMGGRWFNFMPLLLKPIVGASQAFALAPREPHL
jgi:hypothetical protein